MTEKYYPAFLDFKQIGENRYFAVNRNDDKTLIISRCEGDLLKKLSGCRSLDEHMERIIESGEYNISGSMLAGTIESWVDKGFLRSEKKLFKKPDLNIKKEKIISGCITSNRPDMLERWFKTRVAAADYIQKKPDIIVCDDTRNLKKLDKNKNIISKFRNQYSGNIYYFDEKAKSAYLNKIKDLLPDSIPDYILDFSLSINHDLPGRRTPGTNRNALFLITAGNNLYTSDDDIEYNFFSKQEKSSKYSFPDGKVFIPEFFPDMQTIESVLNKCDNFMLLEYFEKFINTNLSFLINEQEVSLSNISSRTAMLQENNLLKIRALCLGYYGARWYENPYLPLSQRNNDIGEFFINRDNYNKIRHNGLNIMATDTYSVAAGDTLMGGTLCLNNKDLIPPCFPQGMRDDTCLSLLLNECLEPSLALHQPVALYHNPVEKPQLTEADFTDVSANMGDYAIIILEKLTSLLICRHGKERLKDMGSHLQNFGKLKDSDFEEQLKLLQMGFLTKKMDHICFLLDLYNEEPAWWADDLKKYYKLLEKEALSSDSVIPKELRVYNDKSKAMNVFKEYLFNCGELLEWWPEIWEAAKYMNMEGQGYKSF